MIKLYDISLSFNFKDKIKACTLYLADCMKLHYLKAAVVFSRVGEEVVQGISFTKQKGSEWLRWFLYLLKVDFATCAARRHFTFPLQDTTELSHLFHMTNLNHWIVSVFNLMITFETSPTEKLPIH